MHFGWSLHWELQFLMILTLIDARERERGREGEREREREREGERGREGETTVHLLILVAVQSVSVYRSEAVHQRRLENSQSV